jgi:hypothetical protein
MSTQVLIGPSGSAASHVHVGSTVYSPAADGTWTVNTNDVPALLAQGFSYPPTPQVGTSVALTTGTVNITSPAALIPLTGTLTGNVTIVLPNTPAIREFDVGAVVMGGFTITFQAGSGSTAALGSSAIGSTQTAHQLARVITEGNNNIRVSI